MGKSAADSQAYAEALVSAEIAGGGEDGVVEKLLTDLAAVGIIRSETEVRSKMDALLAKALMALRTGV